MGERRSLGDALEMTPAKLAFIKGQGAEGEKQVAAKVEARQDAAEKTIDLEAPKAQNQKAARRSSRGRQSQDSPEASEILDQVLVPVTIRLPHRTAQALKRAYLEQKLRHAKPDTLQEIGEEAFAQWLTKNDYDW